MIAVAYACVTFGLTASFVLGQRLDQVEYWWHYVTPRRRLVALATITGTLLALSAVATVPLWTQVGADTEWLDLIGQSLLFGLAAGGLIRVDFAPQTAGNEPQPAKTALAAAQARLVVTLDKWSSQTVALQLRQLETDELVYRIYALPMDDLERAAGLPDTEAAVDDAYSGDPVRRTRGRANLVGLIRTAMSKGYVQLD